MAAPLKPLCYDCLSEDVTVKVIGLYGSEHWYCAADWKANREFGDAFRKLLEDGAAALKDA